MLLLTVVSHPSLLPSIISAVEAGAAVITAVATLFLVLRMNRKVETVRSDVNSKATESTERIEQLSRIMSEAGIEVPPRRTPPDVVPKGSGSR